MTATEVREDTWQSRLVLPLADDCLILAQRLGAYVSFAPELEIDMAISNIALDLLGQARLLYTLFGDSEGEGRSEDDLAMFRGADEFRNLSLVEQPNGDYAHLIARQFFFDTYQVGLYKRLARGNGDLAAIAEKGVREAEYHLDFSQGWVLRLGAGTQLSNTRMQAGVDAMWPYVGEMFAGDAHQEGECGCCDPGVENRHRSRWDMVVQETLTTATLTLPSGAEQQSGGRSGAHSDSFKELVTDMQIIQRTYPGLQW